MDKVGAKLRDARVARGMSVEDVAQETRIPRATIAALEDGDAAALPAPVFVRGFVRSIARALGLDDTALVRELERHQRQAAIALGADLGPSRARPRSRPATDEPLLPLAGSTRHLAKASPLRGGYLVLLLVAMGLLVAAWLMVGAKHARQPSTTNAAPNAPAIQERVDGVSSIVDTVDGTTRLR